MKQFLRKKVLPISLFIGAILLFAGIIFALNYVAAYYEGVASILMVLGFVFWCFISKDYSDSYLEIILIIFVFAGLGFMFDGAGNFIYNKPLEWFLCPTETELMREVSALDSPKFKYYLHKFSCYSVKQGQVVKEIPWSSSSGLRFLEYILLGCLMVGIAGFSRFRRAKGKSQTT